MTSHSARLKDKGQITVPVEIRRNHDLHRGSRVIFEDRGDYIAVIPERNLTDRTAGALATYVKKGSPTTPEDMREAATKAITEENLKTLGEIERDHASH